MVEQRERKRQSLYRNQWIKIILCIFYSFLLRAIQFSGFFFNYPLFVFLWVILYKYLIFKEDTKQKKNWVIQSYLAVSTYFQSVRKMMEKRVKKPGQWRRNIFINLETYKNNTWIILQKHLPDRVDFDVTGVAGWFVGIAIMTMK